MSRVSGKKNNVFSKNREELFHLVLVFPFYIMHSKAA